MQTRLLILSVVISFFLPFASSAAEISATQKAMIQDLEATKYNLSIKYAPAELKKEMFGWDLNTAFEKAKARVLTEDVKTDRAYQKIFREFLKSTQDYHVNTLFYSSSWSFIPLKIKGVDRRYFIASLECSFSMSGAEILFKSNEIDDKELDPQVFDIKVGDEVLAINGTPIKDVIENIIDEELSGDRTPTGFAIAERVLFLRRGKLGEKVPEGTISITLLPKGQKDSISCTLPWFHTAEWVDEFAFEKSTGPLPMLQAVNKKKKQQPSKEEAKALFAKSLYKDFSVPFVKELMTYDAKKFLAQAKNADHKEWDDEENEEDDENYDWRKKGFLTPIGTVLWETALDNHLYAYLALNSFGKKVGYFYLPTFDCEDGIGEAMMKEIVEVLAYFNQESDALVVDITNNPGGSLYFMYAVLSTLTDKPLDVPTHREMLIQEDIYRAAVVYQVSELLEPSEDKVESDNTDPFTFDGFEVTKLVLQQAKNYSQFLMQSWRAGQSMTDSCFVCGVDKVLPHTKIQYAKPLIVLTNEMDFSCADFFPAILQDNGRATIFGARTAGAGGCVVLNQMNSQFGVQGFTVTRSVAQRTNGQPIENLGVTPDVPCEITVKDLQENYSDYIQTLNSEVNRLLQR